MVEHRNRLLTPRKERPMRKAVAKINPESVNSLPPNYGR